MEVKVCDLYVDDPLVYVVVVPPEAFIGGTGADGLYAIITIPGPPLPKAGSGLPGTVLPPPPPPPVFVPPDCG